MFNSDVPEVKLLRLIHDNKYSYKTIKKKFKFRTNLIRMANTNNGNLIIYCTYIPPGNEHDNRLNE